MTKVKKVLVIGGGHNGLICATYLANVGFDVQVLEARDKVGGGAASRCFAEGYTSPSLSIAGYGINKKICKDLNLKFSSNTSQHRKDTIALDSQGNHLTLSDGSVSGKSLSQSDIDAYRAFQLEFRSYAKALQPLMMNKPPRLKDMDRQDKKTLAKLGWSLRFGLGTKSMREFLRVGGINIYDVLNETFDSPLLKGALSADAVIGQHMGPRTPNTVLTYLHRLWGEVHSGNDDKANDQIAHVLERSSLDAGVRILSDSKVKNIVLEESRCRGVELVSGEKILADIVISNTDAKTTFLDLVGSRHLDAMFCHRVNSVRQGGSVAKLNFALEGLPSIKGLSEEQLGQRLIIAPDMRYVEHAFNHAKYGEYSSHPVLEISIPSIADASLAPDGKHVMSVSATFAPHTLKQGWEAQRDAFTKVVVETLGRYAEDFSSLVLHSELLTPEDIEAQYNVSGGHWHHGELSLDQSFMMRPVHGSAQYDTPIDGLYLCGAGTHPGGGLTGVPGHNAAQRIIDISKSSN